VKSLRARLFVAVALTVLVSIGVTVGVGALLVRRSVERDATKSLVRQADLLAVQERKAPTTPERLANLGLFLATQEQRLAILTRAQAALLLPQAGGEALRAGRPVHGSVTIRGTRFLYAARPVGEKAVVVLRSSALQAADWRPFVLSLVVAGLVGGALAAVAAYFLARATVRPIRRVAAASRSLAANERPDAIPVQGSDEVAALAAAFNHMAAELARARDAESSFLLSVSHELKTPLTAIVGHAEALTEHVLEPPTVGRVIGREARRLERLVRDLLELARLNQHAFTVALEPVDLAEIAREAVVRYQAQAEALGVTLAAAGSDGAPAEADSDRVLQVLSNLIENALRCTPSGGSVTVTAAPGSVVVEDTGPGLDPDELPRAFERFYLYDRHRTNRSVGSGLGLAIVKELVEAMHGSVAIESSPGRGARFTVTLPAAGTGARPTKTPDRAD
jgi:two-component system OmpR family sensor kinase